MTKDKKIRVKYFQYSIFIWTVMVNMYLHTKYPIGKIFDPPQEFIVAHQITRKMSESEAIGEDHSETLASNFDMDSTGSWSNCTEQSTPMLRKKSSPDHPDEKITVVSCHTIHYRTKESSFRKSKDIIIKDNG